MADIVPNLLLRLNREDLCRRHVDAAESWLRRVIEYQLSQKYGSKYFDVEGLVNGGIRKFVRSQRADYPGRFLRDIDATSFDHVVAIVCNPNHFRDYFAEPLRSAYPHGDGQARQFLTALRDIRNDLSHGRGCSARQLEKAICYSNDLIDALKAFFRGASMEKVFNVPTIFRFSDSKGNAAILSPAEENGHIYDCRSMAQGDLYPGETFSIEVEIDPSFDGVEYVVKWEFFGHESGLGTNATIEIKNKHVGTQVEIVFQVISKRDWHRMFQCDDRLHVQYRVLPPPN